MKIIHISLACHFTEGMNYQDNILPRINSEDGHQVIIVSDTQKFIEGRLVDILEEEKNLTPNLKLIRLKFDKIFTNFISKKVRKVSKLYNLLENFKPDVILFHGVTGYELLTVAKYKRTNPYVKLYVDSHEDFINSARTFFSKNILHRLFYKKIVHRALKYIDKILYISEGTRIFLHDFYKIPSESLEFFPLGGFIKEKKEKEEILIKVRKELGIKNEDLVLIHSGKLDKLKKTKDILEALNKINVTNIYLLIIGNIPDENKEVYDLIKLDKRVKYLGWKSGDELLEYICASNLYVQPGSQSATSITAVCCGLPLLLYPTISYKKMFDTNVFWVETEEDIIVTLNQVVENPEILNKMSERSYKIAKSIFNYKKIAARLYE